MQIKALYDKRGRILAAVQLLATNRGSGEVSPPQPQPKRGQLVGEFTVPREWAHLNLAQSCAQLVVKTQGKHATLVPKSLKRGSIRKTG